MSDIPVRESFGNPVGRVHVVVRCGTCYKVHPRILLLPSPVPPVDEALARAEWAGDPRVKNPCECGLPSRSQLRAVARLRGTTSRDGRPEVRARQGG